MKKIFLCLLILLGLGPLTACQLNMEPVYGTHEHSIKEEYEFNDKIHWNACDSDTCREKFNKEKHVMSEWTRIEEGSLDIVRSCKCGYQEFDVHVHELSGKVLYDENTHWDECLTCPDHLNEAVHEYTGWYVVFDSTEEETGLEENKCSCGHTIERIIPLKEHHCVWSGEYGSDENTHWEICVNPKCPIKSNI